MNIQTSRFGDIEVPETNLIEFTRELPGFENESSFALLPCGDDSPFVFMQSVTTPELAFLLTDPFLFFAGYEFEIDDATLEELAIDSSEDVHICAILTMYGGDVSSMTANLLAPVVINTANRKAKQVVVEKSSYTTKHELFPKRAAREDEEC